MFALHLQDILSLTVNVVKFNSAYLDPDVVSNLIHTLSSHACTTTRLGKRPDKSTISRHMLDFKSYIKKFVREISGNWTSYVANIRHTFTTLMGLISRYVHDKFLYNFQNLTIIVCSRFNRPFPEGRWYFSAYFLSFSTVLVHDPDSLVFFYPLVARPFVSFLLFSPYFLYSLSVSLTLFFGSFLTLLPYHLSFFFLFVPILGFNLVSSLFLLFCVLFLVVSFFFFFSHFSSFFHVLFRDDEIKSTLEIFKCVVMYSFVPSEALLQFVSCLCRVVNLKEVTGQGCGSGSKAPMDHLDPNMKFPWIPFNIPWMEAVFRSKFSQAYKWRI